MALAGVGASAYRSVMTAPIKTPCVLVCFIDPRSGLCLGCRRTEAEVEAWASISDAERERIMALLPDRTFTPR